MKRIVPLAVALLVAGCATAPPSSSAPTGRWFAGTWLMMEDAGEHGLAACASGLPIRYPADGTYRLWEESGTWRLDGDRLTETAAEANDMVDPAVVAVGVPHVSRIERAGPDRFRKTYEDGATRTFLRCPDAG